MVIIFYFIKILFFYSYKIKIKYAFKKLYLIIDINFLLNLLKIKIFV